MNNVKYTEVAFYGYNPNIYLWPPYVFNILTTIISLCSYTRYNNYIDFLFSFLKWGHSIIKVGRSVHLSVTDSSFVDLGMLEIELSNRFQTFIDY